MNCYIHWKTLCCLLDISGMLTLKCVFHRYSKNTQIRTRFKQYCSSRKKQRTFSCRVTSDISDIKRPNVLYIFAPLAGIDPNRSQRIYNRNLQLHIPVNGASGKIAVSYSLSSSSNIYEKYNFSCLLMMLITLLQYRFRIRKWNFMW